MVMLKSTQTLFSLIILIAFAGCNQQKSELTPQWPATKDYSQLVTLFNEWREFHSPKLVNGIADYSATAMQKQQKELAQWQARLSAFDTTQWPIKHQVDWYLVWAEMNSLDFDHRVKQPWMRDPAFYVWFYPYPSDVPEREGANMHGAVDLPSYPSPLSEKDAASIAEQLRKAPAVYEQAKINLTGNAKDLWVTGIRTIKEQSNDLSAFATSVEKTYQKGRKQEAEKFYQKAIQLEPENERAHYNLGLLYKEWKEYEKAKREFRLSVAFDSTDADAIRELSNLYK